MKAVEASWHDHQSTQPRTRLLIGAIAIMLAMAPLSSTSSPAAPRATPIDAGLLATCALTVASGVKCWGMGALFGDLPGDDYVILRTPVDVPGLTSGVRSLSISRDHACALTNGGAVKCWGYDFYGMLGDGPGWFGPNPVGVIGMDSGVTAITTGYRHSCAALASGGVKCWGDNSRDQLGNSSEDFRFFSDTPVHVVGLIEEIGALTAGRYQTCVVTRAGAVKCWGENMPVHEVSGLPEGVVDVEFNLVEACALTTLGAIKCWETVQGQDSVPITLPGLESGVTDIDLDTFSGGCAILVAGEVKCWGSNAYGHLGDGTTQHRDTPVRVLGLPKQAVFIAMGYRHSCALLQDGDVACWGDNLVGQLGTGETASVFRSVPTPVTGLAENVVTVDTGWSHSCAIQTGSGPVCWGLNASGQLGDGSHVYRSTPTAVTGIAAQPLALGLGGGHSCIISADSTVQCWGSNGWGQLGNGVLEPSAVPVDVIGLDQPQADIAAGSSDTCALDTGGNMKCWGMHRQYPYFDEPDPLPSERFDYLGSIVSTAPSGHFTCVATQAGGAYCQGENHDGQIGVGIVSYNASGYVSSLETGVVDVTTGDAHACALTDAGAVKCWGNNNYGQLGDGTRENRSAPIDVVGLDSGVVALAAGGWHTCALRDDGSVLCWGSGEYGAIGNGELGRFDTPQAVVGLDVAAISIEAGDAHTCATLETGAAVCWGSNEFGQLGIGSFGFSVTPQYVDGLNEIFSDGFDP